MDIPSDLPLTKYEKVELAVLGKATPLIIIVWTLFNLIVYSEAIYIFDDTPVYFYGFSAYLVCLFWIGLSLVLYAHFVLAKYRHKYTFAKKVFRYGVFLAFFGILAALWYTFDLHRFLP
jgi:hypothetical protein